MSPINPFQAPAAEIVATPEDAATLAELSKSQKLIIYAILINIGALVLRGVSPVLVGILGLVTLVLSVIGIIGMATALRFSSAAKVALAILMLVPLVNLIVMLVLNSKATKALRAGGYKVGLLGASKR